MSGIMFIKASKLSARVFVDELDQAPILDFGILVGLVKGALLED